jgi:murein DD-endopeptidase MepM/ murein hydrolase activator NlpD
MDARRLLALAAVVVAFATGATDAPVAAPPVSQEDVELLRARKLAVPVLGVARTDLYDSFDDVRGSRRHEGMDVPAPAWTPVVAVDDGTIAQLFVSVAGGITIYHFDPTKTYAYYYAHLDRWADGLHQGQSVQRGDVIGYVGTSGNAGQTAHLHFEIAKLGSAKRWWDGTPIDPYLVLRDG